MRSDLSPITTPADQALRCMAALERGEPIVVSIQGRRALAAAAETLTGNRLDAIKARFSSPPWMAITRRRAETLKLRAYDHALARFQLRDEDGLSVIRAVADPTQALSQPMIGPFAPIRDADAELENSVLSLCRRCQLLPAAIFWEIDDPTSDQLVDLARFDATGAEALRLQAELGWREVSAARVPIAAFTNTRLRLFRRIGADDEHYVVQIGEPKPGEAPLTRLHSACATGDLFGSLKCDCGPQLHAALDAIASQGSGYLVYLLQEGRGIGLANKLRAYRLQDEGFDTVEANHRLGFDDDERLLRDGGQILKTIGVSTVRLLTNNPAKIHALESAGVSVIERVALQVGRNTLNDAYLTTKARKSGHLL